MQTPDLSTEKITIYYQQILNKSFHKISETIQYNTALAIAGNTFLIYKQLGSGPSPQSCLYFKIFRAQSCLKLFNFAQCCLLAYPNKQAFKVFQ